MIVVEDEQQWPNLPDKKKEEEEENEVDNERRRRRRSRGGGGGGGGQRAKEEEEEKGEAYWEMREGAKPGSSKGSQVLRRALQGREGWWP